MKNDNFRLVQNTFCERSMHRTKWRNKKFIVFFISVNQSINQHWLTVNASAPAVHNGYQPISILYSFSEFEFEFFLFEKSTRKSFIQSNWKLNDSIYTSLIKYIIFATISNCIGLLHFLFVYTSVYRGL